MADFVIFAFPAINVMSDDADDGEKQIVRTYNFTAQYNGSGGAGTDSNQTICQIHDSQAAQARYYGAPVPGVFYGGYGSQVGRPLAPHAWAQGQTLGSGPAFVQPSGAPAGSGPAPFLSSGFASGMRR